MKKHLKLATLFIIFLAATAHATPVQWNIQDLSFDNGSVATGSFVFDRDTNSFTDIAISITAGTDFIAQSFDAIAPRSGNLFGAIFTTLPLFNDDTNPACDPGLFSNPTTCGSNAIGIIVSPQTMSNSGGTLTISRSFLGFCSDPVCNSGSWAFRNSYRNTNVGTISTTSVSSVPLPATFWLLFSGLTGLITVKRKLMR